MTNLQRQVLSKVQPKIKFLTHLFYVTLNNKELNQAVSSMLLSEFIVLEVAGINSRDVIGWYDSC